MADRISSIVMLKIDYFSASKNTEEPGTAFSKCLLLFPAFMIGPDINQQSCQKLEVCVTQQCWPHLENP